MRKKLELAFRQMLVSDIKQQVKRQDRYSVYIDGKYAFSFSEGELMRSGLRIGRDLSQAELADMQNLAVLDKAYDRALNQVARRPRSQWELEQYLKRKEYEPEVIESVIARLRERSYVDDRAFAEAWVRSRRLLKTLSRRRLSQELRAKRVADDIIADVMEQDETTDEDELERLIAKKRQQSHYQDDQKLMQYLIRQGYSYGAIKQALGRDSEADD